MQLFGSSGTRGVVGQDLTPELVLRVARAAGTVWASDRAALARDTRTSGRAFADVAAGGLTSVGVDVDRLGVTPTPAAARYCATEGVPGLVVTASHNPPEYNGLKLLDDDGVEMTVDRLERVEDCALSESFAVARWDEFGSSTRVESANRTYVDSMLRAVDRERIAEADLTVALDPGHGPGALTSPEFYRRLGCRVVTVNAQPDGHFPGRDSEPVPDNLEDLGRLVRTTDADVGIAHDGDADRAVFFDEDGEFVSGDASLAALAAAELDAGDTAVAAVDASQRLVDVVEDAGATLELTPVGSTNIVTRIRELRTEGRPVPIAGEGNGGVFFPEYALVRDGAYVGARFLELLGDRPVSEVIAPHAGYHDVRIDLSYETERERSAMLEAAERYARTADADPNTLDGYRLDYGDAWVLVRPSGTEPKVRIYAEARDPARARDLATDLETELRAAVENANVTDR